MFSSSPFAIANNPMVKSTLFTLAILASLEPVTAMTADFKHENCGGGNTNENAPKILHPEPTAAHLNQLLMGQGFSPKPTQGPNLELLRRRGLLAGRSDQGLVARDVSFTSGELIAYSITDNTCGYISGSLGAPVTCPTGYNCGGLALYPIDGVPGGMFCCPVGGVTCTYYTSCFNSAQVPSKCDVGCQANTDNVLCTNAASPYCVGYTWPDIHATSWGCAAQTDSSSVIVDFTWLGENDGRTWKSILYTPTGGAAGTSQTQGISILNSQASSSSVTSSTSSSTSSSGGGSGNGGGGGKSTNVGAIVGGVIGGLAVLGIAIVAIVFLLLRGRRQKQANATDAAPAAGVAGAGAGVGAVAAGGIPYDPNQQYAYQYPQQHQQHMSMMTVPPGYYGGKTEDGQMSATSPSSGSGPSPGSGYVHPVPLYQPGPTELDSGAMPASAVGGGMPNIHEAPTHNS